MYNRSIEQVFHIFYRIYTMSMPKIVIVGAGVSGIAAATRLIENGYTDITILEAENRIGGRVNSVEFGGSMIDVGAQWVHGEKGNCVYEMVKDLNLLETSFNNYQDNTYYLSNGKPLDKRITDALFIIAMSAINDEDEAKLHPGTFGEYFKEVYYQRIKNEFENDSDILSLAKIFEEWTEKFFRCVDSTETWYDVSNIGPFAIQKCEGDQLLNWKNKGYRTIFYVLMKKLPDIIKHLTIDDKIHLNKEVTKIVWDNNDSYKDGATVTCSDGSSYNADHVIITVSVGVLKIIYKNVFIPELPAFKTNAIEGITLGTIDKIFIKFPVKWWPDDLKGFSLLWTEEDKHKLRKDFPHGPNVDGRSWLEDVFGFYVIDSHPNILLGWVVGKMARDVELLPDNVVIQGCMFLLRQFVGKKYKISEPDGILRSKWATNPHFCGTYSHVSLEAEKRNAKAEDLAKSVTNCNNKQTLIFAGEASHPTLFSTVHGAIETGYRAAHSIISIYKGACARSLCYVSRTSNATSPINNHFHSTGAAFHRTHTMSRPKIVIVGAGASGIAAATRLIGKGFTDVTILEAENRIGGRVNSVEFGGSIVDIGAQWVHGEKGNCVYEMVKGMDLLQTSLNNYQDNTYYLSNGKPVDKSITDRLFRTTMSVINDEDEAKLHPGTFGKYFMEVYNQRVKKEFGNDADILNLAKIFEEWSEKFFLCLDSTKSWHDVSNIGPFVFQSCEGDQQLNWKNRGYRTILYIMMKKFPDFTEQLAIDDKIHLNKEVTKIVWDNNDSYKDGATVICSDGSSYNADHVIVTVSVGVLKSIYKKAFIPELPAFKTNAIEGITLGTVNKILLKFPTKWWPDDLKGFSLLWTEEDKRKLRTDFPHGPNVDGRSWLEDVFGFYVIDSHPRVLLGWVVGKMAKDVESLPDSVVMQGCTLLLKQFVGRKYKVPEPDGVLRSKWGSNPHFCGSYTHVSMEAEKRNAKAEDLAKSVTNRNNKQILLFAGEASHPTRFSTVDGAIETGHRAADSIISMHK